MDGSRKIQVLKQDGTAEPFDGRKLAAAIWRAISRAHCRRDHAPCPPPDYRDACDLAGALEMYLARCEMACVSSAAVFEMTVKVLRRVGLDAAAAAMEAFRFERSSRRRRLKVMHEWGNVTCWDKGWLAGVGGHYWKLMPSTARTISGLVEAELRGDDDSPLTRQGVLDAFNRHVESLGLADAVPVQL